jgi:phospholipid N-methyltransferase
MRGDQASFLGLWLQKPPRIVAVAPSSTRVTDVWRNLPPARVWAYSTAADAVA